MKQRAYRLSQAEELTAAAQTEVDKFKWIKLGKE
jgi:hypothetical protein